MAATATKAESRIRALNKLDHEGTMQRSKNTAYTAVKIPPIQLGLFEPFLFTIVERGISGWKFTNWGSLAKEAANPIVETWGSEQSFDLIFLDINLNLPPSVNMTRRSPSICANGCLQPKLR